jgi:hypothetical protein
MVRLEVRCCCNPNRLLGWVQVADPSDKSVRLSLRVPMPSIEDMLKEKPVGNTKDLFLELPIATLNLLGDVWRAVKAEGTPIETLRRVVGFVENLEDA